MKNKMIISLLVALGVMSCSNISPKTSNNAKTIAQIQGMNHKSNYEGKKVKNIKGVITATYKDKYHNGFYMQSLWYDNDLNSSTSEGIYVENKANIKVEKGDLVKVDGLVKEIQFSKPKPAELTITSIQADNISVVKKGIKVKPVVLEASKIPYKIHTGNKVDKLDIKQNAMDFFESYESMLVKVKDPVVVGATEKYGEIAVLAENGKYAKDRTNNGGIRYTYDNEQTQKLIVLDRFIKITDHKKFKDPNFTPNPGDKFAGDLEGIIGFDYSNYKLYNTKALPKLVDMNTKIDTNKFEYDENSLSVVTYNIENFTISDGMERVVELAKQVNTVLNKADIITLIEVGDDDGGSNGRTDVISADKTLTAIVDQIKVETGLDYGYVTVNPEDRVDGGWPDMHIRNAILYRKDRVTVPYINEGASNVDTKIENGKLLYNPGRLGTNDPSFKEVRKSLVAHFKFMEKDVFVVANHLKSKRHDSKLYSAIRPVVRKTEELRIPEGKFIGEFLKELNKNFPDAIIMSMGDMNDFEFSPTLKEMKTDLMVNTVELLPENERHTYVYKGNSQVLDNLLINKQYEKNTKVDILNINSEFTKSQGYFSDHDPVYIQIKLK